MIYRDPDGNMGVLGGAAVTVSVGLLAGAGYYAYECASGEEFSWNGLNTRMLQGGGVSLIVLLIKYSGPESIPLSAAAFQDPKVSQTILRVLATGFSLAAIEDLVELLNSYAKEYTEEDTDEKNALDLDDTSNASKIKGEEAKPDNTKTKSENVPDDKPEDDKNKDNNNSKSSNKNNTSE